MPFALIVVFCIYLAPASVAASQVEPWMVNVAAEVSENPVSANRRSLNRGERIFSRRCAVCHGEAAIGNGPGGRALMPKPTDLTASFTQQQSDGALFWKITEGRGSMPAWKAILDEDERWNLVNYIKTLAHD